MTWRALRLVNQAARANSCSPPCYRSSPPLPWSAQVLIAKKLLSTLLADNTDHSFRSSIPWIVALAGILAVTAITGVLRLEFSTPAQRARCSLGDPASCLGCLQRRPHKVRESGVPRPTPAGHCQRDREATADDHRVGNRHGLTAQHPGDRIHPGPHRSPVCGPGHCGGRSGHVDQLARRAGSLQLRRRADAHRPRAHLCADTPDGQGRGKGRTGVRPHGLPQGSIRFTLRPPDRCSEEADPASHDSGSRPAGF